MRILILLPLLLLQADPIGEYAKLDFSQEKGKFGDASRDRIALEFDIINKGDVKALRKALKDSNKEVRAFAASALGILGDKKSSRDIEALVTDDSSALVRCMAVQSLGWLRTGKWAIDKASLERNRDVKFMAGVAAEHLKDRTDHAKTIREAYKKGIQKSEINSAAKGKPAPDFTATQSNGRKFTLSARKKKVVVLMFQLADW